MTAQNPDKLAAARRIAEAERPEAEKSPANGPESSVAGTALVPSPEPLPEQTAALTALESDEHYLWQFVEEKEHKIPMTIRVPASMKRDLQRIEKFSSMTMTDVLVEGARPIIERELAKIKARGAR
jgi:hypothetical protein